DFNGFISLPSSPMKRVASQQHIRLLVQDDDRIEVAIRAVLPDHVAKHIRDCLIDPDGIDSLRIIRSDSRCYTIPFRQTHTRLYHS
ncbi:MAG: hypothetical protein KDI66_22590, partial [Xanthomonadales bacterium]|nr:hypothetical protein [Xanthomonadales bacterium]